MATYYGYFVWWNYICILGRHIEIWSHDLAIFITDQSISYIVVSEMIEAGEQLQSLS